MMSSSVARSPLPSASIARRICDSTRPPSAARASGWNRDRGRTAWRRAPRYPLAEPPGDVVLGLLFLRLDEDLVRHAEFDQLAEVHVGGEVRDARRLLHVVRHDEDGDAFL